MSFFVACQCYAAILASFPAWKIIPIPLHAYPGGFGPRWFLPLRSAFFSCPHTKWFNPAAEGAAVPFLFSISVLVVLSYVLGFIGGWATNASTVAGRIILSLVFSKLIAVVNFFLSVGGCALLFGSKLY